MPEFEKIIVVHEVSPPGEEGWIPVKDEPEDGVVVILPGVVVANLS